MTAVLFDPVCLQDPNCQDARGNWAFLKASATAYCKSEILRLLHEASADVRVAYRSGRTALHAASSCDEGDQWLLKPRWLMIKRDDDYTAYNYTFQNVQDISGLSQLSFGNPF